MTKNKKLVTVAIASTLLLTACNKDEQTEGNIENEFNNSQEQYDPNSNNGGVDSTLDGSLGEELTEEETQKWYAFEAVDENSKSEVSYGSKAKDIYNSLLNKIGKNAKDKNTGNSVTGTNPKDENNNLTLPNFTEPPSVNNTVGNGGNNGSTNSGVTDNVDTTTDDPKDLNNGYVPPGKEEVKPPGSVNFEVNSEYKDPTGTTSSKPSSTSFDVYKYVSKDVPVVTGTNVESKLYDQMDKLTSKVVVKLDSQNIDTVVKNISTNYKGKLLVDSFSYGKIDKNNDQYYLIEIEYLVTKAELDKLKAFAKTVSTESYSLTGKEKYSYINKKITALGEYDAGGTNIYSPFSLFNNGSGVCQAYTSMGQIIFNQIGIQNGIATGTLNGVAHTWNVVNIDGKVMHIDFTLNDSNKNEFYLLLTEEEMSKSRTIGKIIM